MANIIVMDACALVALLKNECGADKVAAVYKDAELGKVQVIMNRINLLEVYYGFYHDDGKDYAENIMNGITQSIISISEFNKTLFYEAGRLKASYKISLADSIALAQTIVLNGELLTADHHEFDVIEDREAIRFNWIR